MPVRMRALYYGIAHLVHGSFSAKSPSVKSKHNTSFLRIYCPASSYDYERLVRLVCVIAAESIVDAPHFELVMGRVVM